MRLVSIIRKAHSVLGLGCGVLIALTALSGTILALRPQIERNLNPSLWRVPPISDSRSLDEILAVVRAVEGPPPKMLLLPQEDDSPLVVFRAGQKPEDRWEVFVDPHTAKILGQRQFGTTWLDWVKRFHVEILAGKSGRLIVGAGGLISLALSLSGALLCWKSRAISLPKPSKARWTAFDLHRQVGIVGLIPTTILALTGVLLIFRPYLAPAIERITGPMPKDITADSRADQNQTGPTVDQICEKASRAYPDGWITRIYLPEGPKGSFAVRLRLPKDGNPHGNTAILFDRYDGAVLKESSSRSANRIQRVLWYAPYPWHTGDALGGLGRGVVALSGIFPAILLLTGVLWWSRGFKRGRVRNSASADGDA